MLIELVRTLFNRDLNRLKHEISQYTNEIDLWKVDKNIHNSGGNLCLHLVGNLTTYIGKELGNEAYIRDRDAEFSLKDIPRQELYNQIDHTLNVINSTLDTLDEDSLKKEYPVLVFDRVTSTAYLLIHLTTHLTYHLGQINYHRRLLNGSSASS